MNEIKNMYDKEIKKIYDIRIVNSKYITADAVLKRLINEYGQDLGNKLYSSYVQVTTYGKNYLKQHIAKSTYYRHMKNISDAGISYNISDIKIIDDKDVKEFSNFVPLSTDTIYKVA